MGRIAIMLQTYFIIYGIHNNDSNIIDIKFVSPKNKLKLHPVLETVKEIKTKYKKSYDQNKKIAISCCEYLIKDNEELMEIADLLKLRLKQLSYLKSEVYNNYIYIFHPYSDIRIFSQLMK